MVELCRDTILEVSKPVGPRGNLASPHTGGHSGHRSGHEQVIRETCRGNGLVHDTALILQKRLGLERRVRWHVHVKKTAGDDSFIAFANDACCAEVSFLVHPVTVPGCVDNKLSRGKVCGLHGHNLDLHRLDPELVVHVTDLFEHFRLHEVVEGADWLNWSNNLSLIYVDRHLKIAHDDKPRAIHLLSSFRILASLRFSVLLLGLVVRLFIRHCLLEWKRGGQNPRSHFPR